MVKDPLALVLSKAKAWCYEREFRIMGSPTGGPAKLVDGQFVPLPDGALTAIILGCECPHETKLTDLINEHASSAVANEAIDALTNLVARPPNLEVCFALLGDWGNRTARCLPLLSKIDLVSAVQRLDQLGFRPTLALLGPGGYPVI